MDEQDLELELGESAPVVPDLPKGVRNVICIGGGRGGVGKSLLTVNLGVYLAQLGREVLITDADLAGSGLHIQLGLERAPLATTDEADTMKLEPIGTSVPGLRLLPSAYDPMAASPFRPGRKVRWMSKLRSLPADYILVHLGSGASPATLDLFLSADVGICVAIPDPAAVESTYRFLRALFLRQLRRSLMKERFKLRLLERSLHELPPLPTPLEVIAAVARHDTALSDVAAAQLQRVKAKLVINQTRLRTDLELGPNMQGMAERYLGLELEYVGHVEQDDQAWLTARRRRPLLVDSPTAKSARNLERIARRVVAIASTMDQRVSEPPPAPRERRNTLYDVLGIGRGASDEDVRRAYKRQRELFGPASLPLVSLIDEAQLRAELALMQEAYDTILDPVRRRAYNISTFPDLEDSERGQSETRQGMTQDQLLLQAELARDIQPETEFTGELLRRIREANAIEIAEISARTKITIAHLTALEAERYDELPAEVYVRGFVQLLARQLKLDPAQVVRTYIRRMRDALAARGQG
jgi:flagellar biosynthesis protein FlhG